MSFADNEEEEKYIKSLYKNEKFVMYNNYWKHIKKHIVQRTELDIWDITYNLECTQSTSPLVIDNGRLL